MKRTFVYGDSFSNADACKCAPEWMWYTQFATSQITDRTRSGNSVDESFLKIGLDALTHTEPARFIFGVGEMYGRVTTYTDGINHDESVLAHHDMEACLKHFDSYRVSDMKSHEVPQFHNTLLWSRFFLSLVTTNQLLTQRGHEFMVVHMTGNLNEYNPEHPMIRCILPEVHKVPHYMPITETCHRVCKEANIKAWDFDKFGWFGHVGFIGQQRWSRHLQDKGMAWN